MFSHLLNSLDLNGWPSYPDIWNNLEVQSHGSKNIIILRMSFVRDLISYNPWIWRSLILRVYQTLALTEFCTTILCYFLWGWNIQQIYLHPLYFMMDARKWFYFFITIYSLLYNHLYCPMWRGQKCIGRFRD